jgi:polar amino acid transport system permease protein
MRPATKGRVMHYVFQFGIVLDNVPLLLYGAWLTIRLSAMAMLFGLIVGVLGAAISTAGPFWARILVRVYVEVIRNTPFLVQIFIVYFSLPAIGLRMRADQAALLAMTINLGAYAAEIVRGGIEAVPQSQVEAARALGLRGVHIFRFVVLMPALRIAYPALVSQFILLMLGSSVVSSISAVDLTAITNTLQSTTFRSFEFYFAATLIYLAMALGFRLLLDAVGWFAFRRYPA